MSEEELKAKGKSKQPAKTHWFCKTCLKDFWGAKKEPRCPKCGAEFDELMELTEDGLPAARVREIVEENIFKGVHPLESEKLSEKPKLSLSLSRDALLEMDEVNADMFKRDLDESLREHLSSGAKAKALESKRKLLEEQRRIEDLQGGGVREEEQVQPNPQAVAMLMQTIAGLPEEQQNLFFERIQNPNIAYNLATIINPPKQTMQGYSPYNPMGTAMQSVLGAGQPSATPEEKALNVADVMNSMMEAMVKMNDMTKSKEVDTSGVIKEIMQPIREELSELKRQNESNVERYYDLRQKVDSGEVGGKTLTKEDIATVVDEQIKPFQKGLKEQLQDVKTTIEVVEDLKAEIKGEPKITPETPVSVDDKLKLMRFEKEDEEEKHRHEEAIRQFEIDKTKQEKGKLFLQGALMRHLEQKKKEKDGGGEEKGDEKVKGKEKGSITVV